MGGRERLLIAAGPTWRKDAAAPPIVLVDSPCGGDTPRRLTTPALARGTRHRGRADRLRPFGREPQLLLWLAART